MDLLVQLTRGSEEGKGYNNDGSVNSHIIRMHGSRHYLFSQLLALAITGRHHWDSPHEKVFNLFLRFF